MPTKTEKAQTVVQALLNMEMPPAADHRKVKQLVRQPMARVDELFSRADTILRARCG